MNTLSVHKTMGEVSRLARKTDGFLLQREGRCLYKLASKASGHIVEIGSYKGRSTLWLSFGSLSRTEDKGTVFAIDPHGNGTEEEFRRNLLDAGLSSHVTPILMKSWDAAKTWTREVGMVWIDGSHAYEDARKDFEMWSPFIKTGGIIAFHDTVAWYGTRRAVEECIHGNPAFSDIRIVGSITYARKSPRSGVMDTIQDRGTLVEKRLKNVFWRFAYGALGIFSKRLKKLDDQMKAGS